MFLPGPRAQLSATLLGAILLCGALSSVLVSGSRAAAANSPTPGDLLAANVTLAEVQQALGTPTAWVAWFPQFEVPGTTSRDWPAGFVATSLLDIRHLNAARETDGLVSSRVVLYQDEAAAKAAYAGGAAADADGTTPMALAKVGDESRAFTYEYPPTGGPEDAFRFEAFVRFRVGRAVVIVDTTRGVEPLGAPLLAALASPVPDRVARVLAGTLTAPELPGGLPGLMPPAAVASQVGQVLGEHGLGIATFALLFPDPAEYTRLMANAAPTFGSRVYAVASIPGHLIAVQVLTMKDETVARDFIFYDPRGKFSPTPAGHTALMPPAGAGPLAIGQVGANKSFIEFQFARNKYVVNMQCTNRVESEPVDAGCESVLRKVAELTYANLPTGTITTAPTPPPTPATVTPVAPLPPKTGNGLQAAAPNDRGLVLAGVVVTVLGVLVLLSNRRAHR